MGNTIIANREQLAAKMRETVDPRKLAKEKLEAYQEYCCMIIDRAKAAVEMLDLELVEAITFESTSGDGYGMDNRVIDFGFDGSADLYEAVRYMKLLDAVGRGDLAPSEL